MKKINNKYKIRTLVCQDGVVGLNGWQYLLNDENNEMLFDNKNSANKFLIDVGYTQTWINEWIEIINKNKKETA